MPFPLTLFLHTSSIAPVIQLFVLKLVLEENDDKMAREKRTYREKRTLLNNIPRINANWTENIPRSNCISKDVIKVDMTEVEGIEIKINQFVDYLRNKRRY